MREDEKKKKSRELFKRNVEKMVMFKQAVAMKAERHHTHRRVQLSPATGKGKGNME